MNIESSQSWLELSASTIEDFPHEYPIACPNCCKCIMHFHLLSPPLASHEDAVVSLGCEIWRALIYLHASLVNCVIRHLVTAG